MVDVPLFRFQIGEHVRGWAAQLRADRVGLTFGGIGLPNINMPMTATEARALANALYEAADASEKALPVETLAEQAALDIDAYERLVDDLLKCGRIDRTKFEAVADDAEAVAVLVRDAVGRELLAALKAISDSGVALADAIERPLLDAIAHAETAGIKAEG
ncbi:hypothetical protein [Reyranella massiliensis]|uniref:hypothetical protein n=1 Tax=Reyranella massiliensis TaxID=445220 RepID=UPI00030B3773|nr:hypothetical protein [Reyranella massiliensis]